jgi:hypothetical protein
MGKIVHEVDVQTGLDCPNTLMYLSVQGQETWKAGNETILPDCRGSCFEDRTTSTFYDYLV